MIIIKPKTDIDDQFEHFGIRGADTDYARKVIGPAHGAIKKPIQILCHEISDQFVVRTPEGDMRGQPGDMLMIGVAGELYICQRAVFDQSYDFNDTAA